MEILFTGGSSFTGFWFARELARAGHSVTATFQKEEGAYQGMRGQRVSQLKEYCECAFSIPFASEEFLQLIQSKSYTLFCNHGAHVADYRSPNFEAIEATALNTQRLPEILQGLKGVNCSKVLLTGSVFEQGEGIGNTPLKAFSPYGLSKGLTSDFFRYYCDYYQIQLGKFVIPNPFGPYEEGRFTNYLINSWFNEETPCVQTPKYVRDNIHVSLLAKGYVFFAQSLQNKSGNLSFHPSGYVESQGRFTQRFSKEMGERLSIPCAYELADQTELSEPLIRINTDYLDAKSLQWSETQAWDELALHYEESYQRKL